MPSAQETLESFLADELTNTHFVFADMSAEDRAKLILLAHETLSTSDFRRLIRTVYNYQGL